MIKIKLITYFNYIIKVVLPNGYRFKWSIVPLPMLFKTKMYLK